MASSLSALLLNWYSIHARTLPWRDNPLPYWVWVSEIMLQQTRVETVLPYFERWIIRFPSIRTLALATQQEVLTEWEGLGYYSRARNLHRAAQIVMSRFGGVLPDQPDELVCLPGIGSYTAAAVASIAYGHDVPALDGNVRRVLSRVFDVAIPPGTAEGDRTLNRLAVENLPAGRAGDYNQALMDLGASVCTPREPNCDHCPIISVCLSYRHGVQAHRPVVLPKAVLPHHTTVAAVVKNGQEVLIKQRPENGLLGGMWGFPGGAISPEELPVDSIQRHINRSLGLSIDIVEHLGVYKHAYTHFRETQQAFLCSLSDGSTPLPRKNNALKWISPVHLQDYPMGKIDRRIAGTLVSRDNL